MPAEQRLGDLDISVLAAEEFLALQGRVATQSTKLYETKFDIPFASANWIRFDGCDLSRSPGHPVSLHEL